MTRARHHVFHGDGQRASGARAVVVVAAAWSAVLGCSSVPHATPATLGADDVWVATWAPSPQLTEPRNMPPQPGLRGSTLRQIAHVSLGGRRARVRVSNEFGDGPVVIGAASVAVSRGGGAIDVSTRVPLTFAGRPEVTVQPGVATMSDPVSLELAPLSDVAITLYVREVPAQLTGHPGSRTTSYIVTGNHVDDVSIPATAVRAEHWYLLSGVEVERTRAWTVAVLGNSIADGRGSGTDRQNRWPDNLARRLQQYAGTVDIGVVNAGIGGNCVLRACLGPAALDRLDRDVLAQRGAKWLIVSEGVNDIGGDLGGTHGPEGSSRIADSLVGAYRSIIRRAHDAGLRAFGATILPFGGSQYDSPAHESARQRVNAWIRTSGAFDAVVDFDSVMRDPARPSRLRPDGDTGDHLHPNELGYRVMAGAVDLSLFGDAKLGTGGSLRLAKLFSDGLVLQRRIPIHVWGWADPGATVTVRLSDHAERAAADASGRWSVHLPAAEAGGPYELRAESAGNELRVGNVMIGDVWVASGQSNMEFELSGARNGAQEAASAHDSLIRQYKVPISFDERPQDDLAGGSWVPADPQHAWTFSAVAYFFARELREHEHVPIGIINTTWGGSAIETWSSTAAQGLADDVPARALAAEHARLDTVQKALVAKLGSVPAQDPGLVNGKAVWADPALDDSGWPPIEVPALWETRGYEGMDGVAWYRTTFTLSAGEAARGASLSLGPIDDDDVTWVNGVEVGRTNGYNVPRSYTIPATALHAGTNVLAVRVADGQGGGGIYGSPEALRLTSGGAVHPLAGSWRFNVGQVSMQLDGQRTNKLPAVTYNHMLHPLLPFPIEGVIWYQGESNANTVEQATAYRHQLPMLVQSWREAWRPSGSDASFPFLWVQLPNYGARDSVPPTNSGWATIRESMTSALTLPNTGQAITIDVGGSDDLHPKDKETVGRRLALVARRVAYGENVESSGPTLRSSRVENGRMIVEFDHAGAGLVSRSTDGSVDGFAIAGADRRFVWAKARVEGSRVVVWSDAVRAPVAVRYAWMNDPEGSLLFNRDGLPAAPFRTDPW